MWGGNTEHKLSLGVVVCHTHQTGHDNNRRFFTRLTLGKGERERREVGRGEERRGRQ